MKKKKLKQKFSPSVTPARPVPSPPQALITFSGVRPSARPSTNIIGPLRVNDDHRTTEAALIPSLPPHALTQKL